MAGAIPIELIQLHDDTQPRVLMTQQEIAADYAKAMVEGREFPPVDVFFDGKTYWLADGYHRLMAAESLGLAEIDCAVHAGGLLDAIWFSCSANAAHGLRRTRDDVQLAIHRALKHPRSSGKSDRQIAEHVGCSDKTVGAMRHRLLAVAEIPQQAERTGRDGKTYRADANRGRQAEPREPEQIDLEDAIARAPAPAAAPSPVPPPAFDQTWWFLATHLANTLREQRRLPDARTAALNFPPDQIAALSLQDAEYMVAWWAEFLPLWRGRQGEFAAFHERERERINAKMREMDHVA